MSNQIVDIDSVRDMALEHMGKDWIYRGRTFNMFKMGWTFYFNDRKKALGLCSFRNKTIYLSSWFIENGSREMKMWVNTMVHEIAHAINKELGGSGHDWQWRDIFKTLGGNGERTSSDNKFGDLINNPISKYTNVCDNGHTSPSYRKSRTIAEGRQACRKCCNKFNGGEFSNKYLVKQVKNY